MERPKRINFYEKKNPTESKHELTVEEVESEFGEAPNRMGLIIEEQDWLPYCWDKEHLLPWSTLLTGVVYDKNRKQAVHGKIKIQAKIHCRDFLIKSLYIKRKGPVIAWIQTTENKVKEVFKRAAHINSK